MAFGGRQSGRDLQAIEESANPDHESPGPDIDIQAPFEWVVNRRQRQRGSQSTVKPGSQQTPKSDERGGAAESQARDDEDETEAEHDLPHYLPNSLDLFVQSRRFHSAKA